MFDRGFTGHEHLDGFNLINMNGRVYDPVLGRFLSPDNYVQMSDYSQNFNRYSYALNNPLVFTDPSGEFWHIVIGAAVGGVINVAVNWNNIDNFWDGAAAFGIGAAAGAIGAATGGAAFALAGGAAGGMGGFLAGAAAGAVGSAYSMPITSIGNNAYFGTPMMTGQEYLMGIGIGAVLGGSINVGIAAFKGNNFWTGKNVAIGRGVFSFNNTPLREQNQIFRISPREINTQLNANTGREKLLEAVPDYGPAKYKMDYYNKVSGTDGQHVWNRHTIEIVVDNGKVFNIVGGDGKPAVLVQQLAKHHGTSGIFEIVVDEATSVITHQRFIPGGVITGAPNQVVIGVSNSVSPAWPWWQSTK